MAVEPLTRRRLREFLAALDEFADQDLRVYLSGGACALLHGWRDETIDVDLHVEPPSEAFLRGLSVLKRRLDVAIDLASPIHVLPELPRWRERSPFVCAGRRVTVFEFDPYAQTLAAIVRGHANDLPMVHERLRSGQVDPATLRLFLDAIEPELVRFPALDAVALREDVEHALTEG